MSKYELDEEELAKKAQKLLDVLSYNAERGHDNIPYLKFVLRSFYDRGYTDGLFVLESGEKA